MKSGLLGNLFLHWGSFLVEFTSQVTGIVHDILTDSENKLIATYKAVTEKNILNLACFDAYTKNPHFSENL